uniref:Uncharacterized protein n=1 Tax=Oryza sativa subsp. japonica TaxID=39947 RepID=Q69Y55_ORYSJ|nr:hypothetical protein [Oryza sativa Japonica Group]
MRGQWADGRAALRWRSGAREDGEAATAAWATTPTAEAVAAAAFMSRSTSTAPSAAPSPCFPFGSPPPPPTTPTSFVGFPSPFVRLSSCYPCEADGALGELLLSPPLRSASPSPHSTRCRA